jgi:hypothetical protein
MSVLFCLLKIFENTKNMKTKIALLYVGLTLGNFAWQAFDKQDFRIAFERSWFQGVALAVAGFILRQNASDQATASKNISK